MQHVRTKFRASPRRRRKVFTERKEITEQWKSQMEEREREVGQREGGNE